MKNFNKIIPLALMLGFSYSSFSADLEGCTAVSSLASTIMDARQNNVDIVELHNIANKSEDKEIMIIIINRAYSSPLYSTEKYKTNSIRTFKNEIFLECIE